MSPKDIRTRIIANAKIEGKDAFKPTTMAVALVEAALKA